MKKIGKKLLSLFVAAVMILTTLSVTAVGASASSSGNWRWPVTGQIFGRGFGAHKAIDIVAPTGTTVVAAKEGTVVCASMVSASASYQCPGCTYSGAGYHVVLRHPDGFYSFYDHLSSVSVTSGAYVSAGQKVGAVGSTGNSSGAHLHFAISSSGLYSLVDPLLYLTPFSSVSANVTSNDVTLTGVFGAYGPTMQTAGFYIGTSRSNMTKITETLNTDGYSNGAAIQNIFYSMSKWYPHLVKGNIYYYKMYITRDGKEYCSDIYTFTYGTHTHTWNSGIVTKSPTCTANGVKTYTCTSCNATKTETIAALGHSYGGWSVTKQAGCTSDGEEVRTCSLCGHTERSAIKATGHNYSVTVVKPTATSEGYTLHKCLKCGDNYKTDTIPPIPDTNAAKAVLETKNAVPGDTVTVDIVLENVPALKSLAVKDITYDSSKLELVGGTWKNVNGAVISDWNSADKNAVLAFSSNTDLNKAIFTLTFKVADDADDAAASVECTLAARQKPENGTETEVEIAVIPGSIIISKTLRGDVNGDGYLDSDDAIYMLSHVLMPEMYSINQNGDFNKDGSIDSDDAIYLLYYVLMPDLYPLK